MGRRRLCYTVQGGLQTLLNLRGFPWWVSIWKLQPNGFSYPTSSSSLIGWEYDFTASSFVPIWKSEKPHLMKTLVLHCPSHRVTLLALVSEIFRVKASKALTPRLGVTGVDSSAAINRHPVAAYGGMCSSLNVASLMPKPRDCTIQKLNGEVVWLNRSPWVRTHKTNCGGCL